MLLEKLVEDINSTVEEEAQTSSSDPYQFAINSIRPRAIEAAIFYGLWVHRHVKEFSSNDVLELETVLEKHLDPRHDPSLAVRSIYGVFLPILHGLDANWIKATLSRLFPGDRELNDLRKTAWEAYVRWSRFDLSMLELLRQEYAWAIDQLGSPTLDKRRRSEERLGEHLMTFYWHGKLELGDPLLDQFFKNASDNVRGRALGYMGRSLQDADRQVPAETLERLTALWQWRVASGYAEPQEHTDEMAAFGQWFASDKFIEDWALDELESSLNISGKIDFDHQVAEQLAKFAHKFPAKVVRCLGLMVDGAHEDWRIHHWSGHIASALTAALGSSDEEAMLTARALINRLAARGFLDFAQLLDDDI